MDGETLRLCISVGGHPERPSELKAEGKTTPLITLKRVKDEKKEEKKDK